LASGAADDLGASVTLRETRNASQSAPLMLNRMREAAQAPAEPT